MPSDQPRAALTQHGETAAYTLPPRSARHGRGDTLAAPYTAASMTSPSRRPPRRGDGLEQHPRAVLVDVLATVLLKAQRRRHLVVVDLVEGVEVACLAVSFDVFMVAFMA